MSIVKKIHLYQETTNGRVKHLIIEANKDKLITQWYTSKGSEDGKKQETIESITGLNQGKTNETSAPQQCLLEWERKVKKKKDEGYIEYGQVLSAVKNTELNPYQRLPKNFAPCKPISEKPADATSNLDYIVEKKLNGECIILHSTENEDIVYSRRMIDITKIVTVLPDVEAKLESIPAKGTIIIGEVCAYNKDGKEEKGQLRAFTSDKTTVEKATKALEERTALGYTFVFHPYDIYFIDGKDISKLPFVERNAILEEFMPGRTLWQGLNEEMLQKAKELEWEGFILRKTDSIIDFTLNGKPSRTGAWKFKFKETEDAFIWGVNFGSGKFENIFAEFKLGQYLPDGTFLDCGYCGPGTLSHKQLAEITEHFKALGYTDGSELLKKDYIVVELEFDKRLPRNKNNQICFEFPEIQIFDRQDKTYEECIFIE